MSRWYHTDKMRFKKHYDIWDSPEKLYKVTTDQKEFLVHAKNLDYKKTIENMKRAGYTNINIFCMGRDVTFKAF